MEIKITSAKRFYLALGIPVFVTAMGLETPVAHARSPRLPSSANPGAIEAVARRNIFQRFFDAIKMRPASQECRYTLGVGKGGYVSAQTALRQASRKDSLGLPRGESSVKTETARSGPLSFLPLFGKKQTSTKMTSYYPKNTKMEGGLCDRQGYPLNTLEDFIRGHHRPEFLARANRACDHKRPAGYRVDYVSVAGDLGSRGFKVGQSMRIPQIENLLKEKLKGRPLVFKVVDTGRAFQGKGTARIDVCRDIPEHRSKSGSYAQVPAHVQNALDQNLHLQAYI